MAKSKSDEIAHLRRQARKSRNLSHQLADERTIEDLTALAAEYETRADMIEQQEKERSIAETAHQLWEAEGRPEGRAEEHWFRAIDILEENAKN